MYGAFPEHKPSSSHSRPQGLVKQQLQDTLSSEITFTFLFYSPFFTNKRDIEFISLQIFSWVAHDLVKGIF